MADDKKHAEIDAALVRQLAEILNETDLTEVEVERGELRIRVAREVTVNAAPVQYATAPAPVAAAPARAQQRAVAPAPVRAVTVRYLDPNRCAGQPV